MKPTILIDADSMIYKAGFATQNRGVEVVGDANGEMIHAVFDAPAEAAEFVTADIGLMTAVLEGSVRVEDIVQAEPVENCLQILKTMLTNIVSDLNSDNENTFLFLSGPANYRDKIATIKPYKGNRDKAHKPVHFEAMRDYLLEHWDTSLSDDGEADDDVSIAAWSLRKQGEHRDVWIVHIDKDLDQIPGKHWNYSKAHPYYVTQLEGASNFFVQVLSGDTSDNVGGCYKVGPKKAEKIVDTAVSKGLSADEIWALIEVEYVKSIEKNGCPYDNPYAAAIENAQLVYLQQQPNELWLPKGLRGSTL